jgi:hypothetical protein
MLAFTAMLRDWLQERPPRALLSVCLVDEDDGAPIEVCLADALRALEPVAPYLGRVTVAARPARSAMLAALSRRRTGISVAADADRALACLQEPALVAGLGRDFRGAALAARARRLLSTAGVLSPKSE